jgi:hypothetical protein
MKQLTTNDINEQHDVDPALVKLENARMQRKFQYPSIEEQLDDLFHQGAFSSEMMQRIQEVKDRFPKESTS